MFSNLNLIKAAGFVGFKTINQLRDTKLEDVPGESPTDRGVYLVLRTDLNLPVFLEQSIGGHFKGREPTVSIDTLRQNWVDGSFVIYIGKAGASDSHTTLRSRLKQYLAFGEGRAVGHWGGRYIWQIAESEKLTICWKATPNHEPRELEQMLIQQFKAEYSGNRPFANLVD